MRKTFMGFRRANGEVGIRNYILVLSMVNCSNTVAQQIAWETGAHVITHDFGCVEVADQHERTVLALTAAALNPNVYGAVLIGLGCEQTDHNKIKADIEAGGKQAIYIGIQDAGGPQNAKAQGIEAVKKLMAEAEAQQREEFPLNKLVLGVQCGGSDWTTALSGNATIGAMADLVVAEGGSVIISEVPGFPGSEHVLAERAVTTEVGLQIMQMCDELRDDYLKDHGQKIEEVNPTPGNKMGGITTLVEKSMGNIKKIGKKHPIQGLIRCGEHCPHPGIWILDLRARGIDGNATTGFALSGALIDVFSTGRGSPLGNVVMPTLKLTGNPTRYQEMPVLFDFNAGVTLEGVSLEEAGEALVERVIDIASGEETKSEINGDFEFMIPHEKKR